MASRPERPTPSADAGQIAASTRRPTDDPALEAAARTERDLAALKEQRDEERFIFILAGLILIDCLVLGGMNNFAAPLVIGVLQLVFVIALARRLGIDDITVLLTRLLYRMSERADK